MNRASVILAPDVFIAHREASWVLSMAVSTGGIAHLRDRVNDAPAEVTHLEKTGRNEFRLRGVWGSSRCDSKRIGMNVNQIVIF